MKYNFVEQYVTLSNPFLSDYPPSEVSEVVYDSFEAYDSRKNAKFAKLQRKTK
jgi:hypothetical protein